MTVVHIGADQLYDEHGGRLFAYCYARVGARNVAEWAVNATFDRARAALANGAIAEPELDWLLRTADKFCAPKLCLDARPLESMVVLQDWRGRTFDEIADELDARYARLEEERSRLTPWRRVLASFNIGPALSWAKGLFGGASAVKVTAAAVAVLGSVAIVATPLATKLHHAVVPSSKPAPSRIAPKAESRPEVRPPSPPRASQPVSPTAKPKPPRRGGTPKVTAPRTPRPTRAKAAGTAPSSRATGHVATGAGSGSPTPAGHTGSPQSSASGPAGTSNGAGAPKSGAQPQPSPPATGRVQVPVPTATATPKPKVTNPPTVTAPTVTAPTVTAPTTSIPQTPTVSTPSLSTPEVPTTSTPSVPSTQTPTVPSVSTPGVPSTSSGTTSVPSPPAVPGTPTVPNPTNVKPPTVTTAGTPTVPTTTLPKL